MSEPWQSISSGLASWYEAKLFLEHSTAVSHDALHVVLGVVVQLTAALFLRRSVAAWVPWFVALGLTIGNEIADIWFERWPSLGQQLGEAAKDVTLTMLLPTLLLLAARGRPDLFRRSAKRRR